MTNSIPMNNHFSTPVNAQELHFDKLFEQLSDFVKLNRRQPSKSDDMVLWGWCGAMRYLHRVMLLPDTMVVQLNSIGFMWSLKEAAWFDKAYMVKRMLQAGKERTTGSLPPDLSDWLQATLLVPVDYSWPLEKKIVLGEINVLLHQSQKSGLAASRKREAEWTACFQALVAFRQSHTDRWPHPGSTDKTERKLAKWVYALRYEYKKKTLSPAWTRQLEEIAFDFKHCLKQD
jgi:hypothetical protein